MSFWQQIQNAADMGTSLPWLVLVFFIAAIILFVLKPSERIRIRTAVLLFGLSLVGLLAATTLLSYGHGEFFWRLRSSASPAPWSSKSFSPH